LTIVATDFLENVFIAGSFDGLASFGGEELATSGQGDIFIAKFSNDGKHLWSQRFGDAGAQTVTGLAVDAVGDVFLAGDFTSKIDFGQGALESAGAQDVFIARFSADGELIWGKSFGDSADQHAAGIAVGADGGVVVTGAFKGILNFGGEPHMSAGKDDVFVAKLSGSGDHVWSKRFGDGNFDQGATSIAVESTGTVVVTGGFKGSMDIGDGLISQGLTDAFVAKFVGTNGDVIWSKNIGSTFGNEGGQYIAPLDSGELLLVGGFDKELEITGEALSSAGGADIFVLKLTNLGEPIWIRGFGSNLTEFPFSGALGPNGKLVLGGVYGSSINFGGDPLVSVGNEDIFLAELDQEGNHIWSRRYGGEPDTGIISSVAFGTPGVLFATGWFNGTVDLGGGPLTSKGDGAIFLAKYLLP
jgi:hypothetical protein